MFHTYSPSCFGGSFTRLNFPPNMVLSSCWGLAQQETSQCICKGSNWETSITICGHTSPYKSHTKSIFQPSAASHGGNLGMNCEVGKLFRFYGIHPTHSNVHVTVPTHQMIRFFTFHRSVGSLDHQTLDFPIRFNK